MSFVENRIAVGALLGVVLFFAGAVAGLFYGSAVLPPGQGLAGPAIVLGWGVGFGAVASVVGMVLAATLPIAKLKIAARIVAVAGALALVVLVGRIVWVQIDRASRAEEAEAPRPAPTVPTSPAAPAIPVD